MAHSHNKSKFLMFFPETTVCQPPQAPDNWGTSGTRVEFISVDCQPKQELIVDPTAEANPLAIGKRTKRKGIRNVEWSMVLKMHGIGKTTTVGTQATATYLSTILGWCLGNTHRTYSRAVASSADPATLTLAAGDTVGFIPGCMIAVEDTTSPSDEDLHKLHFRRVLSVNGVTHTITLSEDLPFAPAPTDVIHATITAYVDRSVLKDAVGAPGRTFNWLFRNDESGTDLLWQLEGTVATLALQNLARGQLPQLALSCMSGNFSHTADDGLSAVTMPPAEGTSAQLAMGIDVQCSIGAYGVTDIAEVEANAVAFETGITRSKVETATEKTDRFEGLATYSYNATETKFNTTLVPFDPAWYAGLNDDAEFRINYYQPGPGPQAGGKAWCLHIARAQIAATPTRADVGDVNGVAVEFSAMIPSDCTGGSNEHIEQSPFLIALA
ncbi:hypothetical protein [Nannocystis punicea]|uniref:Uncharacterized protein n=1 Tax=Nannocystis punicea TaxID=2995304 RepID=A0ABY7HAB4_9BACT|nr:hypothetical protein [Nannocystis poenicansa]WAS96040.1 hypothetical protein O0S08_07735 [Nannocystis poenicansa]